MNHQQLEKDIEHLEYVIAHLCVEDRLPLSYWRTRLASVSSGMLVPSQRLRVRRLDQALNALEARRE